jgi:hypothetical protein
MPVCGFERGAHSLVSKIVYHSTVEVVGRALTLAEHLTIDYMRQVAVHKNHDVRRKLAQLR